MLTFQDLLQIGESDKEKADFVRRVINDHESSALYKTAKIADDYDRCRNTTTMQYQKYVSDVYGNKYLDSTATVHRSTSNFFNIFTTQLNQYLLGNGISWKNGDGERLGANFDTRVQRAGKAALCGGVSFGFWNLDHLEVFPVYSRDGGSFAPLYDEESGALSAGVRYWQIDASKPLRATIYEKDGYTNFMWSKDEKLNPGNEWERIEDGVYMIARKAYIVRETGTDAEGKIYEGENYPTFPIVPLWGNPHKDSEIIGLREKIDAYDFILNGWEDDLDNAQLYWIINGAAGMDDPDLTQFLDRLRTVKAAAPMDGQDVQPVTVNIPVEARNVLLERLERQLYRDAMILNPEEIAGGAVTATQIRAAYERQNTKADQFEYCVLNFLQGIMKIVGVEDKPSFTRSTVVNTQEEIQTIISAANFLSQEYVTRKVLELLGDGDKADEILKNMSDEAMEKMNMAMQAQAAQAGMM